jgi:hypothetical protein
MATATIPATNTKVVRLIGLISLIAGLVMIIGGGSTWLLVRSHLVDEHITVAADAASFAGQSVDGPLQAYAQADIINHHALKASGGKTYAQLAQDDPVRATVMNGSFLRASLFTSVIAFGVAAFAMGVGLLLLLIGWALRKLVPTEVVVTEPKVIPAE